MLEVLVVVVVPEDLVRVLEALVAALEVQLLIGQGEYMNSNYTDGNTRGSSNGETMGSTVASGSCFPSPGVWHGA